MQFQQILDSNKKILLEFHIIYLILVLIKTIIKSKKVER